MLWRFPLMLLCFGLMLSGCAQWDKPATGLQLPIPKIGPDALLCEIAFVQWDTHQVDSNERLWQSIDEQFLPTDIRRRLSDNGLRIGLISGQLPEEMRDKLESNGDPIAALTSQTLAPGTEMLSRRETRQCHERVAEIIEVLPERSQTCVVLFSDDGSIRAERFERPRGFIELEPTSRDGLMHVQLTPGIDHGQWKPRVMANQGGLRYDHQRDQRVFSELSVATHLSPGQVLVITSTRDAKGLGATFFANRFSSSTEQLFLLIRLSRGRSDDLFDADEKPEPLISQR